MKITVIQEKVVQPDLNANELTQRWESLKEIPGVTEVNIISEKNYPNPSVLSDWIADSNVVFGIWIGPDVINRSFLNQHPQLQYIGMLGHGYEPFDKEFARSRGLTITNTIYGAQTIAEYTFALLLDACHHVGEQNTYIQNNDWKEKSGEDYTRALIPQIELYDKTIGIIGLGAIGYQVAKIAHGFGMHVIAYSRHKKTGKKYDFIEQTSSLHRLLKESDFISLNVPHTKETEHMINKETIGMMKDGVIIVNSARGALIDEEALREALISKKVKAAAVDVLTEEPPRHSSPLLGLKNCTVTGHIAWLTRESRFRAIDMAISQFRQYLAGQPVSVID